MCTVTEQKFVNRVILELIRTDETRVAFHDLLTNKARNKKDKKALEILGSSLSTMTEVPAARDHRKVFEQIKFENKGIEKWMEEL